MIENFQFNNDDFTLTIVNPKSPGALKGVYKQSTFFKGECMGNSYEFAKITGCLIVEGFLITEYFSKKDLDVVGHIWNKYNALQFDLTVGLINENDVKDQYYYPLKEYKSGDAFIEPSKRVPGKREVVFQTYLKEKEQDARKYINQLIENTDGKVDK